MIGRAYAAGVDFFINKPINLMEVTSVIRNVESQIRNERTLANLKTMFMTELDGMAKAPVQQEADTGAEYEKRIRYVLNRVGMSGEKGAEDIVKICNYLRSSGQPIASVSIGRLCEIISPAPKNMEQRIRRAIISRNT